MNRRLELHEKLCGILGTRNVYFQQPESIKMSYPAIVYKLDKINEIYANGSGYLACKRYSIILIDRDPDTIYLDKMLALPMCRFERFYPADNLNHYVFSLYY